MSQTSREKTLASVQLVLAERGYVVIGIKPNAQVRYEIGQIVDVVCAHNLGQPFSIIAVTDWRDWVEQCKLIESRLRLKLQPRAYFDAHLGEAFYRAATD